MNGRPIIYQHKKLNYKHHNDSQTTVLSNSVTEHQSPNLLTPTLSSLPGYTLLFYFTIETNMDKREKQLDEYKKYINQP